MKTGGEQRSENNLLFFLAEMMCFWKNMFSVFESSKAASLIENQFLER